MRIAYKDPLEGDNKKKNPRYYESSFGFDKYLIKYRKSSPYFDKNLVSISTTLRTIVLIDR